MILTREQLEARNSSEQNLSNILHKIIGKGQTRNASRGEGNRNRTNEERALIALSAKFDSQRNVARAFGVSQSSVSAYVKGQTSHNKETSSEDANEDLKLRIEEKESAIASAAAERIMESLNLIDPNECKNVRDRAAVAVSLATVYRAVRPENNRDPIAPKVIIFAPGQRSLDEYNVVEVESKG